MVRVVDARCRHIPHGYMPPPQPLPLPPTVDHIEAEVCKGLVQRTWRGMLNAISQLLQRSTGEELVLQLLKVRPCGGSPLCGFCWCA